MNRYILLLLCTLLSSNSFAINWDKMPNISFGTEVGFKSLSVIEKNSKNAELAKMSKGLTIVPSVVISSNAKYIWEDDNWGYHVQVKGGWYTMDKQTIDEQSEDLGTQIKGISIYAVPVGYYHFNKKVVDNWTYKLGLGAGLGWVSLDGDTKITKTNHTLTGEMVSIDNTGFGTAMGIYFEANYKNHSVVLQNYAPQISDNHFFYQQHNIVVAYRYQIEKQWFKDVFEKKFFKN
ncbi:hypothetical protein [Marinicellulosiphila megalodicopiae]|uniref:hypothetical protein n=1 Tax=Marinicellulosiphila megalodicopiae TaxID=2724896 RepID=UPI003BB0F31E